MSDEARPILPVKDAYDFGVDHGLSDEVKKIKSMEIEWDSSYTTTVRRGFLIELFTRHGLFEQFKNEYWPTGNTPWGLSRTKFFLRIKQRYEDFLQTGEQAGANTSQTEDEEDAEEQAFAAESDLRDFLAKNLACLEKGLQIFESKGVNGVEYQIDDGKGRIDLLAIDRQGRFVVIELKLGRGRNKTLGQLLYYMGWVDRHLSKDPCRGMIIAKDIPEDLTLAVKRVPGVSLFRYNLSVTVEAVAV